MNESIEFGDAAAAEALASFTAFLDATPAIGFLWAQDRGDTLVRAMKARYAATKRGREVQPLRTFSSWCAAQPDRANLLPNDHPVNRWAASVGLSDYFIDLAWHWFCQQYGAGGRNASNKYRDWLATFDDSVRRRYGKLWYVGADGKFNLTTEGLILAKQFPDERP